MKTVKLLKASSDESIKTPQVRVICMVIEEMGGMTEPVEFKKVIEEVDKHPKFVSRQGAARVVKFYEKPMIEGNLILVEGSDRQETPPLENKRKVKVATDGDEAKAEKPKRTQRKKGETEANAETAAAAEEAQVEQHAHHGHGHTHAAE